MGASRTAGCFTVGRILELLAVLTLSLSVVGLVATRLGMFDAPPIWMAGLLMTVLYHRVTADSPSLLIARVPAWHVLVVLVVGLLFRLTPDAYILGGQDQGVYVNMAMHLARTGDLIPVDPIAATITDPVVRDAYLKSNYFPGYLPGVYATPTGLVFQFYHLFPIWLALFGDGSGPEVAVYGLTFLSLLSLLFMQRLAHQITGSMHAGLVAGLLLATNPLHAFFSRFPVTEVPTLAFSLMSFAFLLAYWNGADGTNARRAIFLSVSALAMMFMTRISGFMYLPFLLALLLSVLLFDADTGRRKGILVWASAIVVAYVFSVLYGLTWSAPYARDIYHASFGAVLGPHWKWLLVVLLLGVFASSMAIWALSLREGTAAPLRKAAAFGAALLPWLALGLAVLGAYKAYRLGFTDAYAADPWLARFAISHQGWLSVFSTALGASVLYLSPFVLLGFFVAAFKVRKNPVLLALLLFVVCFLGIATTLNWKVYYQPYYARYLLSEFVPYAILLVVCVWASLDKGRMRALLGGLLLAGGLSSIALSAGQLGKSEHEGVAASLEQLTSRFDAGDLVLIDAVLGSPTASELKTALLFTKALNVATVSNADLVDGNHLAELTRPFDEAYLITGRDGPFKHFSEVEFVHFTEWAFVHGASPPLALWLRNDGRLRILKFVGASSKATGRMSFGSHRGDTSVLGSGWSGPEPWGVWSNSQSGRLSLGAASLDYAKMKAPLLLITGRLYITPKAPTQRINVLVNGKPALGVVVNYPQTKVTLAVPLPPGTDEAQELEIQTPDAISPAQLGYSGDARALAFGLETIELREAESISKK